MTKRTTEPGKKAPSLSHKIFISLFSFALGIILILTVGLTSVFYISYESDAESQLVSLAERVSSKLDGYSSLPAKSGNEQRVAFLKEQLDDNVRYTLVADDGHVLYDSVADASSLENHSSRPEIKAARESGNSVVARHSTTIDTDTVYAASRLKDGSVVRLAEMRGSSFVFAGTVVLPLLAIIALAAVLSYLYSRTVAKRITKPFDSYDLDEGADEQLYQEIQPFIKRIKKQRKQLKQQNAELAAAESMRRDFSSNVSHEMKTPLQVISGYSELLMNGMVSPEDRPHAAAVIYDEARSMRALINDVLVLSRLDESAFDKEKAIPVDVSNLARHAATRLECLADERGVTVNVMERGTARDGNIVSNSGFYLVKGNETLLEQMMHNLIENGIRYNDEGGSVTVSLWHQFSSDPCQDVPGEEHGGDEIAIESNGKYLKKAGQYVVVRVEDTGQGIPAEKCEKIFERFFRLDESRSKETGGTGLGLAIVKHAVVYHRGTITVESTVGKGTAFELRLPSTGSL